MSLQQKNKKKLWIGRYADEFEIVEIGIKWKM